MSHAKWCPGAQCLAIVVFTLMSARSPAQEARPPELETLFQQCLAQMKAAPALVGEKVQLAPPPEGEAVAPFFVQRPGCWSIGPEDFEIRSDGKVSWTIQRGRKRYIRKDQFWTHDFGRHYVAGFEAVLASESKLPDDLRLSRAEFDGRACLAARFAVPAGFDRVMFFDLKTSWPAGYEQVQKDGLRYAVAYRKVRVEKPRPASAFTWKPEPDFVEIDPNNPVQPVEPGTVVADVTLEMHGGKSARLSELLAGQKAVLLDFWFVDCPPCRHAMPIVEALADSLKEQKLALVGVNFGDRSERIATFLEKEKHTLRVARNGTGANDLVKAMGVPSFPALFLLDADRKVLWHSVGFDRAKLESALRTAGFELREEKR